MSGNVDLRYEVWRVANTEAIAEAKRLWSCFPFEQVRFKSGNDILRDTIPMEHQVKYIGRVHKEWLREKRG